VVVGDGVFAAAEGEEVGFAVASEVDEAEAAAELAERTESGLAQVLGRTFLLYKAHPRKPKIVLP